MMARKAQKAGAETTATAAALPRQLPDGGLPRSVELYWTERVERARSKGETIGKAEWDTMMALWENGILGSVVEEDQPEPMGEPGGAIPISSAWTLGARNGHTEQGRNGKAAEGA